LALAGQPPASRPTAAGDSPTVLHGTETDTDDFVTETADTVDHVEDQQAPDDD